MNRRVAILIAVVAAGGCASARTAPEAAPPPAGPEAVAAVQPGAPGEGARAASATPAALPAFSDADVRFMRDMIAHHAQALEMTELAARHAASDDVRRLARRIDVAQREEIALMQRWLERRGLAAPEASHGGDHAHHAHHGGHGGHGHAGHGEAGGDHALMPGMLTVEEMAALAAARGADFDRRFLESMIRHHEGALVMVGELFASERGGQEAEINQFAAHVDSDQRIEIARMQRMLQGGR